MASQDTFDYDDEVFDDLDTTVNGEKITEIFKALDITIENANAGAESNGMSFTPKGTKSCTFSFDEAKKTLQIEIYAESGDRYLFDMGLTKK